MEKSETNKSNAGEHARDAPFVQRFVLHPHRSLSPHGFLVLMLVLGLVSFITGVAFALIGAWPVLGFFGLDVALVYWAFKLNFRSGRLYETVEITRETVRLERVYPEGRCEVFDFNPFYVRVRFNVDRPDGRTSLALASHGREVPFGRFLTDEERREVAGALQSAFIAARGARI